MILDHLAGIMEVSGALTITARKDRIGPLVMVQIQSSDKALPDLFAARFGGKVSRSKCKKKRWVWTKRGKPAQSMLRTLRPHIVVRGADFDRLLAVPLRNKGGSRHVPANALVSQLKVAVRTPVATTEIV